MQDSRIPAEGHQTLHQVKSSQHSGRPQSTVKVSKNEVPDSFRKTWGIAEVLAEEIEANEQNQPRSVLL